MSEPNQSPRLVRRFTEVLGLIARGEFVQSCDEAMRNAVEAIRAQPGEKGKAHISIDIESATAGFKSLKEEIEKYRLHPERRKGTATALTLTSLIELTNRHKTANSVVFCQTSWPNPSITSVINYHEVDPNTGKAQFGDHRVNYAFPLTDEFKAWADQDGEPMSQADFAAFIEERVAELAQATPDEEKHFGQLFQTKMATPADMFTLSRGLEVNVAGVVKQTLRLLSGETKIAFEEEHRDSQNQPLVVPGLFMISVPAFLDSVAVRLPARLRYRLGGGKVTWFFQLYRWKELLRERVLGDIDTVRENTDLPVYEGSPER